MERTTVAFCRNHSVETGAGLDGSTSCPANRSLTSFLENEINTALTRPTRFSSESGIGSLLTDERLTNAWIVPSGIFTLISRSFDAMPGAISHGTETILPLTKLIGIEVPETVLLFKKHLPYQPCPQFQAESRNNQENERKLIRE